MFLDAQKTSIKTSKKRTTVTKTCLVIHRLQNISTQLSLIFNLLLQNRQLSTFADEEANGGGVSVSEITELLAQWEFQTKGVQHQIH